MTKERLAGSNQDENRSPSISINHGMVRQLFKHTRLMGLVVGLIGGWMAVHANPTTYSYTGANYNLLNSSTDLSQPYTPDPGFTYSASDALTFSFTLANTLAANSTTDLFLQSVSWTANDGKFTSGGTGQVGLLSSDPSNPGFSSSLLGAVFTTDSMGDIISWQFDVFNGAHSSHLYSSSAQFSVGLQLYWSNVNDYVYSRPGSTGNSSDPIEWAGTTTVGSWTTTGTTPAVPDSGSALTSLAFALGLLGLLARSMDRKEGRAKHVSNGL